MRRKDRIIGSLIGGAAGDALGYAVEFWDEERIFGRYGDGGIRAYELDPFSGKALISDDTQMTLFTAEGIVKAVVAAKGRAKAGAGSTEAGNAGAPAAGAPAACTDPEAFLLRLHDSIAQAYIDWLWTQEGGVSWEEGKEDDSLLFQQELHALRAPGNTCLSALRGREQQLELEGLPADYISDTLNRSKGCGGVMRIAPVALVFAPDRFPNGIRGIDMEGAQAAAITHGAPLGWLPGAVVTHIINRIVYPERKMTLPEIVREAGGTVTKLFRDTAPRDDLEYLNELLNRALELAENDAPDLENIHELGEGWVGEEAMAVAIYCALRYQDDFAGGITAAVNHCGDSDSTGAVCGNILGAWLGDDVIGREWKEELELEPLIRKMAEQIADCDV